MSSEYLLFLGGVGWRLCTYTVVSADARHDMTRHGMAWERVCSCVCERACGAMFLVVSSLGSNGWRSIELHELHGLCSLIVNARWWLLLCNSFIGHVCMLLGLGQVGYVLAM